MNYEELVFEESSLMEFAKTKLYDVSTRNGVQLLLGVYHAVVSTSAELDLKIDKMNDMLKVIQKANVQNKGHCLSVDFEEFDELSREISRLIIKRELLLAQGLKTCEMFGFVVKGLNKI